jgi:hypothetical protein
MMRSSYLCAVQGAGEQRTELYFNTVREQSQPATQQCAKTTGRICGFATKSASGVRRSQ